MDLDIAIQLTVHNRKDKTLKCLENVYLQKLPTGTALDIYLTDDGCTDGTAEIVSRNFPQVNIIKGNGNLFWNRGMYKAWEAASKAKDYDYYLWLNDDTILLPNAIIQLLMDAKQQPNSVIVGSTCSSTDSKRVTYGGQYAGRTIVPNGYLQKSQTFNGNIVLIPREVFKCIGNLDWTYEHAIGDLDYGWMVTRSGRSNYVSGTFLGICDRNSRPVAWTRSDVPLKERWRNFHSPLGYGQPEPMFHFNRKNHGLLIAVRVWMTSHVRVLFPWIWKKRR